MFKFFNMYNDLIIKYIKTNYFVFLESVIDCISITSMHPFYSQPINVNNDNKARISFNYAIILCG